MMVVILQYKGAKHMECLQLDHQRILSLLPSREINAHKGTCGKLLLLCGSRGYTGAAALSAMGALRVGAGLVYLGVPECIYQIEAVKLLEPIVLPLPDMDGMLAAGAIEQISELAAKTDAILIGPGLGRSIGTDKILQWTLENFKGPIVIDADGIYHLRNHIDILRGRKEPVIITPHEGEFSRLMGFACTDRIPDAVSAAKKLNAIVVLKGHNTVITDGNMIYTNPTGNPGMAVGGSGDVLAGMIVGLIGQGMKPLLAAAVGAWIHGAAGDQCAKEIGMYGLLPSDILNRIPRLLT
jgi:NAD(P)H-hydrate epimerase